MDLVDIKKEMIGQEITISGWIKNHRKQSEFAFITMNDGTRIEPLQVVYDKSLDDFTLINKFHIGSSIEVKGIVKESLGQGQSIELIANSIKLLGDSPEDYPLQPKRHSNEFLRSIAHLRPRTNLYNAIFSIRSKTSFAIHEYFTSNNYVYVHTPLLTTADCEGENQMFKVTTLDMDNLPLTKEKKVDMSKDLFNKKTYITGTGQLHGETFAHGFKKIYTFGPTFRTENSNTKIHANEFWMIEPEICFCDLEGLMDIEEDMLKYVVNYILTNAKDEIEFLNKFVDKTLKEKLENLVNSNFVRINHSEVVDLLLKASNKWEFIPEYDGDLAKEHEKYICEHFNSPVFVTNWPKDIKAYYMKENDDQKTVAAVDLLVPGVGELMGGSQREERYDVLKARMEHLGFSPDDIKWYFDLRKYGTTIHSGFGLGFERLLMYLTGMENIRDVIPFPRTPGNCDY